MVKLNNVEFVCNEETVKPLGKLYLRRSYSLKNFRTRTHDNKLINASLSIRKCDMPDIKSFISDLYTADASYVGLYGDNYSGVITNNIEVTETNNRYEFEIELLCY